MASKILLCLFLASCVFARARKREDHCSIGSHRRVYIEHGNEGVFIGEKNIECVLEIVTCPSCVIEVDFNAESCNGEHFLNSTCVCDLLEATEPPYEALSSRRFCGKSASFVTLTRSVAVRLVVVSGTRMRYRAQRNRLYLSGEPGKEGKLSSPYFPAMYPHDLNVEYFLTCATEGCLIRLIFSDFQLATKSIIEFFDWNGVRLDVITGAQFRPPAITSTGPSLVVRFYANGGTSLGYRALYVFHISDDNSTEPQMDCGGNVDDLGGAITMMDMTKGSVDYDCVWIVKPSRSDLNFNSHIYLKIAEFVKMGVGSKIVVRLGGTSQGKVLEVLKSFNDSEEFVRNPREHIATSANGFYVHLKGSFGVESRVAVSYAGFSYARGDSDCFTPGDFLCENRRCITRRLACDGFDQCGDSTDEPAMCFGNKRVEIKPRFYSNSPNYIFPKNDPYSDLRTATLVFVISSLGLVGLVSALFVLLYRINVRARGSNRAVLTQHVQVIADALLEEDVVDREIIIDDPPVYEPPPCYEECVSKAKPRRPTRKNRRRGRTSRASRRSETPSTPPPRYEEAANSKVGRRWRSHGELLVGGNVAAAVRSLLVPQSADTASDSELLNMCDSPPPCNCHPHCDCENKKFNTR